MTHLETANEFKNLPKDERIIHEGFDFVYFWLKTPSYTIFAALDAYRQHRTNLLEQLKDKHD